MSIGWPRSRHFPHGNPLERHRAAAGVRQAAVELSAVRSVGAAPHTGGAGAGGGGGVGGVQDEGALSLCSLGPVLIQQIRPENNK